MKTGVNRMPALQRHATREATPQLITDVTASSSSGPVSEETSSANTRQTSAVLSCAVNSFGNGKVNGKQMSRHFFSRSSLIIVVLSLLLVSASCQPPPDCPNLPNTDGQPSLDGTTCECFGNTYWDASQSQCVVDCTTVTNAEIPPG